MKPYYQDEYVQIFHGDCRDILPQLPKVDLVLTDPPYGIQGGKGNNAKHGKGLYTDAFADTPEYVLSVVVPVITECISRFGRVVFTPPTHLSHSFPQPKTIGCFFAKATASWSSWGILTTMPIFYYGKDPRAGVGQTPDGLYLVEAAPRNGHPCAKPTNAWTWLTNKCSLPNETILDPFLGSGTTAYCAKKLNRKCIGIEIEEKYCEIAARRCQQEVMRLDIEPKSNADKQQSMV